MGAPGCPLPNKKGYRTREMAERHMWGLLKKSKSNRHDWQALGVYRCDCGRWHVGHQGGVR